MGDDIRPKYLHDYPKTLRLGADSRFRIILKVLRKYAPPDHPVRVRRIDCNNSKYFRKAGVNGWCHLANASKPKAQRYFLIVIHKNASWDEFVGHLMHEWAHTLTWYVENRNDHGAQWSAAYGRLYRLLVED